MILSSYKNSMTVFTIFANVFFAFNTIMCCNIIRNILAISNQNSRTKSIPDSAGRSDFMHVISIGMDSGLKPQHLKEFCTVCLSILFKTSIIVLQICVLFIDLILPPLVKSCCVGSQMNSSNFFLTRDLIGALIPTSHGS